MSAPDNSSTEVSRYPAVAYRVEFADCTIAYDSAGRVLSIIQPLGRSHSQTTTYSSSNGSPAADPE
ncbi:MAG: hypothetical protein NT069_10950 [Planctomycetota bacterium]|nr:hypothetical protein [Planctomycetota bacterium]